MGERLTDLVGDRIVVTNPMHADSRWVGKAVAYSDGPAFLVELDDGHRLMLPATWADREEGTK